MEPAPKDPILGVTEAFLADPSPSKVNVGVVSFKRLNKINEKKKMLSFYDISSIFELKHWFLTIFFGFGGVEGSIPG